MRLYAAVCLLAMTACASTPKPAPAQPDEPIRTQEEIAADEATGAGPADPVCTSHPNAPGCQGNRGKKGGPFDDTAHRNRFVHDESGHDNPGNPAMQSR